MAGLCVDLDSAILNKFAKCLINTLLNLAAAQLEQLKQLILAQIALLDVQIAALILRAAQYDILAQQYRLVAQAIRLQLDEIQNKLNALPVGLLDPSCLEWANINGGINQFFAALRAPLEDILNELERILSFQDELQRLRLEYEALKKLLLDTIDLLDALILEAKCREAAAA